MVEEEEEMLEVVMLMAVVYAVGCSKEQPTGPLHSLVKGKVL